MIARATLFEIDTLRVPLESAERIFNEEALPRLEGYPGFCGVMVMRTPEGKGMVISLWQDEQAARAGVESGFWESQIAKFVTFMRQPPGREQYEVIHARFVPDAVTVLQQR